MRQNAEYPVACAVCFLTVATLCYEAMGGVKGAVQAVSASQLALDARDGTITQSGHTLTINPSTGQVGSVNIFFNFTQFNVASDDTVSFDAAAKSGAFRIFANISGPESVIDGTILSQSGAHLYLINPNGIYFGAGAKVVGMGPFTATSAAIVNFSDGSTITGGTYSRASASAVPTGVQLIGSSGSITVDGASLMTSPSDTFSPADATNQVNLIGSGVYLLNGTSLQAQGGRINLISLASGSVVIDVDSDLMPAGDPTVVGTRAPVAILNGSVVDTSTGLPTAGQQRMPGVIIADGSDVTMGTPIGMQASAQPSALRSLRQDDSSGSGGRIAVDADGLFSMAYGAVIDVSSDNSAGGNISVLASAPVNLSGNAATGSTGLLALGLGDTHADGGNILLQGAPVIELFGTAQISAESQSGGGGLIDIQKLGLTDFLGLSGGILSAAGETSGGTIVLAPNIVAFGYGTQINAPSPSGGVAGPLLAPAELFFLNPESVLAGMPLAVAGQQGTSAQLLPHSSKVPTNRHSATTQTASEMNDPRVIVGTLRNVDH